MKWISSSVVSLALCAATGFGQKMMAVLYENSANIVERVTAMHYVIEFEGNRLELSRADTKALLVDHAQFLPGFIRIEDETVAQWDTDEQNNSRDGYRYFRYSAKVAPNRQLPDVYVVFEWPEAEKAAFIEPVPVKPLEADKENILAINFWIPERFRLEEPKVHFMSLGFEVGTSRDITPPVTPYEYALQNAEGGVLPDGNIKPLAMPPLPPVTDEAGNRRTGNVMMMLRIDDRGYVSEVQVRDYSEWVFAKAAMMTAPFYLFQPRIRDGQPVPAKVMVPFKFHGEKQPSTAADG